MCLAASALVRVLAQFVGEALGDTFMADRFLGSQLFGQPFFKKMDMHFLEKRESENMSSAKLWSSTEFRILYTFKYTYKDYAWSFETCK